MEKGQGMQLNGISYLLTFADNRQVLFTLEAICLESTRTTDGHLRILLHFRVMAGKDDPVGVAVYECVD